MNILLFNGFLLLGFVISIVPEYALVLGFRSRPVDTPVHIWKSSSSSITSEQKHVDIIKRCYYDRIRTLLKAQCSNLDWDKIPSNLHADIKMLDASRNRIRVLTNNSLASYKDLAFIYLHDNFLQTIEEATFANQHYLEVLDVSTNGCNNLPKNLLQLPYLHSLYLGENQLTDSLFNMEVTSPIKVLELGTNKLTQIPNIGAQPDLIILNVSTNLITSISTEDVAPFCSLKHLNLSINAIKFKASCECQIFNTWIKLRKIAMKPDFFNCNDSLPIPDKDCNVQFSNRTYKLYNECLAIIQQKIQTEKARSTWITVVSCVSVLLCIIFVTLFCVHKRNHRQRRKQKEQQQLAASNANTELLNSNLTTVNS